MTDSTITAESTLKDLKDGLVQLIEEAEKRGVKIILAVGRRLPRWPECHLPDWLKHESDEVQKENMLPMLKEVVTHYKDYESIVAWQVENEPFFPA